MRLQSLQIDKGYSLAILRAVFGSVAETGELGAPATEELGEPATDKLGAPATDKLGEPEHSIGLVKADVCMRVEPSLLDRARRGFNMPRIYDRVDRALGRGEFRYVAKMKIPAEGSFEESNEWLRINWKIFNYSEAERVWSNASVALWPGGRLMAWVRIVDLRAYTRGIEELSGMLRLFCAASLS